MPDSTNALLHLERSGTLFDLDSDSIEDIHLSDIASNLARIPRWNGNTCRPMSVAEHSILVFQIVQDFDIDPVTGLQALLHDATEAYIGDVPAPVKSLIPQIKEYETKLWARIARRFELPEKMSPVIKDADWTALFIEASCLCKTADISTWRRAEEFSGPALAWIKRYGHLDDKTMPHPEMIERVFLGLVQSLQVAISDAGGKSAFA